MPRQSCPRCRSPLSPVPGPLLGRAELPLKEPVSVAAAAPVRRVEEVEMRIIHHKSPIPQPVAPGMGEALCLLSQQNALLTDILASINALTAATLAQRHCP